MNTFRITKIKDSVYGVLDEIEASFYIVKGSEKTAVIDTGMSPGKNILPVVRSLTDQPLFLVLTHAHPDHFYHMGEFDEVYLCHEELKLEDPSVTDLLKEKNLNLADTGNIRTGDVLSLGDRSLEVFEVPGHSPGSVVFYDAADKLLFTGDALGSGSGSWMHIPGALTLDVYLESLKALQKWLVLQGGDMRFCCGHDRQKFESLVMPGYNPVSLGQLADLIDLVDGVIQGEIVGRESSVEIGAGLDPVFYASYGRAELQYLPEKIHRK